MSSTLLLGLLGAVVIIAVIVAGYAWSRLRSARRRVAEGEAAARAAAQASDAERERLAASIRDLEATVARLAKWERVADADAAASALVREAEARASALTADAARARDSASQAAQEVRERAQADAERTRAAASEQTAALIRDAQTRASALAAEASALREQAEREARQVRDVAQAEARSIRAGAAEQARKASGDAAQVVAEASARADAIIAAANAKAEALAGDALRALQQAQELERTVSALENTVQGYGDRYLVPGHTLLDALAEGFGHTEAGQRLKAVRDHIRTMVRTGRAATCDYVEPQRRETAVRFVVDAFNGKADSILAEVRHDNAGTLQQQLRDAFALVNLNGKAFRNARITDEYLAGRLEELQWAAVAHELKLQEREEQRRIKEQIREEEKARREFERAMREAAKEEEMLRRAMAKAEEQMSRASDAQRAKYEGQLAELAAKLSEAEARNQRAVSMAQQTRRGHVYVISNVGSLGEHVYKIGLTRRLDPLERIRELGDSSVPFEFDVHALIFSDDAPALEHRLHKHFVLAQVNKVNYRKEFFRTDLAHVRAEIEQLGLTAQWTMTAAAREYRETLAIEAAIKESPAAREAWIKRQLLLEATTDPFAGDEAERVGESAVRLPNGAGVDGAAPAPMVVAGS